MAERLILRCCSQYISLPLFIQIKSWVRQESMDSCGAGLSSFQFDFHLVCSCMSPHHLSWSELTRTGLSFFWGDKKANYYIAFVILSEALEDPSFGLPWIHILNSILNYFYIGLLLMCFILSLGNRPQGSKWGYTLAMIGFALITIYMTVCSLITLDFAVLIYSAVHSYLSK